MACSMLVPDLSLMFRSQARRGLQSRRGARFFRAAVFARGGGDRPAGRAALRLTQEMRSYEFGWLLWSFGDRTDYAELTHHPAFRGKPDLAGADMLPECEAVA